MTMLRKWGLATATGAVASLALASSAAANDICAYKTGSPPPGVTCAAGFSFTDESNTAVQSALNKAITNPGPDTVHIGAGTFTNSFSSGFSAHFGTGNPTDIVGQGDLTILAGPGNTPSPGTEVILVHTDDNSAVSIRSLAVRIPASANSINGISAIGNGPDTIDGVTINAASPTQTKSIGVVLYSGGVVKNSAITLPRGGVGGLNANTAVDLRATSSSSPATVQDSKLTADYGATAGPLITSGQYYGRVIRCRINAVSGVATTNVGELTVEDSLINLLPDLQPATYSSSGLDAYTFNGANLASVTARHVTVDGTGVTKSYGARSLATGSGTQADLSVTNSIFTNVQHSYQRFADSNGMATGSISYSDYNPLSVEDSNGMSGVGIFSVEAGNVNLDPGFTNAAGGDYSLTATSPLIDNGDPAALAVGESATDLAGNARVVDGNGDGTSRRDIGAFERPAPVVTPPPPPGGDTTPPDTKAGKFAKKTRKHSLKLRFSSTEAGSTFTCKLDKGKAKACKSPYTAKGLKPGKHVLTVIATDAAGNADPTPAKLKFKVQKPKRKHHR